MLPYPPCPVRGPLTWGSVQLSTRWLLAPLAGYTNLAFRLAVREIGGVGLCTTELISAIALVRGSRKTLDLIRTCPADRPLAVQIFGSDPAMMRDAAQWLQAYGVTSVDINMGCPVEKITRGGAGSALMCDVAQAVRLVQTVVEAVHIPVTVKMRLGWDDRQWTAPALARECEQIGVAAVIIHGRTRQQGFTGTVHLRGIRAVVEAVQRIPVIGNGDVRTIPEAWRMLQETGCAGIAIGRGALLNPWIFRQLHEWETLGQPQSQPDWWAFLAFMERHFTLQVEERGERIGCATFRKPASWYSKVLRPGKRIHGRLMQVRSVQAFQEIVSALRGKGPPLAWRLPATYNSPIPVPAGPIAHW
ncbi:putative tRNA-dihydrouridine synthase [bacterium HR36]|nr:putative tRNA-dihydrouridine synthase [bacterium HR36]